MRNALPRRNRRLMAVAALCAPLAGFAQTVTVSATLSADETSIQAAIDSLAPGGSRDDGNPDNNVVQIIDGALYAEALVIDGMGLVLEGTGAQRPTIMATGAQAASGATIRIDTDGEAVLRNVIVLPSAASPPDHGLIVDEFTDSPGAPGYHILMEDVLVAANDGSNQPLSEDGATPRGPGTVPFADNGIEFFSTPASSTPEVELRRVVVTAASSGSNDMVRVFIDNGAVLVAEGCRFTFSNDIAVRFNNASGTTAEWIGTAEEPIVLHGNGGAAIRGDNATTRSVGRMEYAAVTRNSLVENAPAVLDIFNGSAANVWVNVVIAGNSSRESDFAADGPFSLASPLTISNSIVAGDSVASPKTDTNLMRMTGSFSSTTADGVCIDLSRGSTSLNEVWQPANSQTPDGILGGNLFPTGAGVTNEGPDFVSLELASPWYLAISNPAFATAGTGGGALTGPGRIEAFPFSAIHKREGNLQSALEAYPVPGSSSSSKYIQPSFDELMVFRSAMDRILAGRYQAAADRLGMVNYDLIVQDDEGLGDYYVVLEERSTGRMWRGLHAVDLSPERQLVVQSPHPLFDGTRLEGIDLFVDTDAAAFTQSGTHRNNSADLTPCDGTQSSGDPYHLSDMAHNDLTFYQVLHEQFHRRHDGTLSLSVHGMGEGSDPADVTISNGTTADVAGASLSKAIADRMNEILSGDPRFAVSHQEPGQSASLSGSTNTQGRYTNGSHTPCLLPASAIFPERFIHMEQDPDVRSGSSSNWAFVTQTFNDLIPVFDPVVPAPPEDGSLVADYGLDGNAVSDTATPEGSIGIGIAGAPDRFGTSPGALSFAGSGLVSVPDFEYTGDDFEFTLALWFKAPAIDTSFQYMFSHGSIGEGGIVTLPNSLHVYLASPGNEPRVRFTLGDGREWNFDTGITTAPDEWHLFTLAYGQAEGAVVYIDGTPAGSKADHTGTWFDPEGALAFGGRTDGSAARFFGNSGGTPGLLDSVRIWNSALSAAEVAALLDPPADVNAWSLY